VSDIRLEDDRVLGGRVLLLWLVFVVGTIALSLVAWAFLGEREHVLHPAHDFSEAALPAPHRVAGVRQHPFGLPHPRPTLAEQQRLELQHFEWVDKEQGLLRIPIEDAMRIVAGEAK
jgi:hypothetical protein